MSARGGLRTGEDSESRNHSPQSFAGGRAAPEAVLVRGPGGLGGGGDVRDLMQPANKIMLIPTYDSQGALDMIV